MAINPPIEFMDLLDGQETSFHVVRWEEGSTVIHPTTGPREKTIGLLRLWVRPEDKRMGTDYWDIVAQTTISRLRPYLARSDLAQLRFTVRRHGVAPAARDEITVAVE